MYHLASKIKLQVADKIGLLAKLIAERKLDTTQRVDAALEYLLENIEGSIDLQDLEKHCGIGVIVTPEEIEREVEVLIKKHKDEILEKRWILALKSYEYLVD